MVNQELVRLGYAQIATYPPDVKYEAEIWAAQREAMEAELVGRDSTNEPSQSTERHRQMIRHSQWQPAAANRDR